MRYQLALILSLATQGFAPQDLAAQNPPAQEPPAQDAPAQSPSIRLDGIPPRLEFPVPAGENPVLQVEVLNARATSVWLATSKAASKRLQLSGAGAQWQINLADPRVMALAVAAPQRSLRVFAAIPGTGRTIASTTISFRLATKPRRARLFVLEGKTRRALLGVRSQWVHPASISRLEFDSRVDRGGLASDLVIGTRKDAFSVDEGADRLVLNLTADLRDRWERAGVARVEYSRHGQYAGSYALRAIPRRLASTENPARFEVVQRNEVAVPGTGDWLFVRLGDVTFGQVVVSLRRADGLSIFSRRSMRQGDEVTFEQHGTKYSLLLDKLVNELIGSGDRGVFLLQPHVESEYDRREEQRLIRDLIARMFAVPGLRFWREGQAYTAYQTKKHLNAKMETRPVKTVEEFIRVIASRSSTTGRPYRVRLPDGVFVDAEKWLRAELVEVRELRRR